ncbi:MAG: hypothetical protein A2Y91_02675 [Chloroflexi bacterium RBG_13_54_8]|nr:MAG: hypothetical protein A2Y91_02675 [Chloroflexi bacterium RBG_13_54_8]
MTPISATKHRTLAGNLLTKPMTRDNTDWHLKQRTDPSDIDADGPICIWCDATGDYAPLTKEVIISTQRKHYIIIWR